MIIGVDEFSYYKVAGRVDSRIIKKMVSRINLHAGTRIKVVYDADINKFVVGNQTGYFLKSENIKAVKNKLRQILKYLKRHGG
jgi:hypothetical protein